MGTTFYTIRIWTIDSPGEKSNPILKRYSEFDELNEQLRTQNYLGLPILPQKKLFLSARDTAERQQGLEIYLKELINRKDTRNSLPVTRFLKLDSFCPQIMFNVPQLLIKKQYTRNKFYINCCLFLQQHNIYVIAITDKSSK